MADTGGPGPSPGRGTLFSVVFVWQAFERLPPSAKPEAHGRDELYEHWVGGRVITDPLDAAITWFEAEFP
jgi:hypothetical protein